MTRRDEDEPVFFDLNYVTITRDPRSQLVLTIGGDFRATGILQTADGFHSAPGAARDYHRRRTTCPSRTSGTAPPPPPTPCSSPGTASTSIPL